MGYSFTLEAANTVANLAEGKIISCYNNITSSEEDFCAFLEFVNTFEDNLYLNYPFSMEINEIRSRLNNYFGYNLSDSVKEYNNYYNQELLDVLKALSYILNKCKIKSLLLPQIIEKEKSTRKSEFLMSEETMRTLVNIHPGNSCLILQPKEAPKRNKINVFDAFPNFEVALRQINSWPAVLLWDKYNYAFLPVNNMNELKYIYQVLKYERNPINYLNKEFGHKASPSHYYFHLSDLHFGSNNTVLAERRLEKLVQLHMKKLGYQDNIDVIITGDMLDSPKENYFTAYKNFSDKVESMTGRRPICVVGNHDVYNHGLALFSNNKVVSRASNDFSNGDKLIIDDVQKTIFLKFNSVTDKSLLAEGKIGNEQLSEMGNELDKIDNLNQYTLIALLHHHVTAIPKPDWYDKKWFQKLMSDNSHDQTVKLVDAKLFIEWLRARNVKLILHGHKHIPFVSQEDGLNIVACGSSTGNIAHKEKDKTYISYNLLKIDKDAITCLQYAEEIFGAGANHISTTVFNI